MLSRPAPALLAVFTALVGCAARKPRLQSAHRDPARPICKVWRPGPTGNKLFVEARLGDGEPRLFLVDTGASISVLSQSVADELGLEPRRGRGVVIGLSGQARWNNARLDTVDLGPFSLHHVDVAVGVPGLPERVGLVPVAGVLGNNVWQHFTLLLDYPANTLALWRPEHAPQVPDTEPMHFNGEHILVEAVLEADADALHGAFQQPVWLEVDTGAAGLLLAGRLPGPLAKAATEGVEPILGVGAGDDLPMSNFLQRTRRVELDRVTVGGVVVEEPFTARWINYDAAATPIGPAGLPGLLGHQVMDEHRVLIDYQRRAFALLEPEGEPTPRDVHSWALHQLKRPRDPEEALHRAELLAYADRADEAIAALHKIVDCRPDDAGAVVLLSRLLRYQGDPDGSLALLLGLPAAELVDRHALIEAINDAWLTDQTATAERLAVEATQQRPEAPEAWVALSDIRWATGALAASRRALAEANRLDENPDGHLLRRAWLASEEGDIYGAMTHLRRLMSLYPSGNLAPWLYAHLDLDPSARAMLVEDLQRARARLHPGDGPLDFFAGALARAGASDAAAELMRDGIARDCAVAPTDASRDNCEAWYRAMAGVELDQASERIQRAVDAHPDRSDFQDTLAVVAEAKGDLATARDAARLAARADPSSLYFLWQAARLEDAAGADGS